MGNGTAVSYTAESSDKTQWETGIGTYNSGVVSRTTVRESSNSNSKVNFSSVPNVWLDIHAQDLPLIPLASDISISTQSGTSYALQESDLGTRIRFTSNSAVTVTLPNSMEAGFNVICIQVGTATVTFSAAGGAALLSRIGATGTAGQYSEVSLTVDSNAGNAAQWILSGDGA